MCFINIMKMNRLMKITSYELKKGDSKKTLSIVIPTKSISGNLFKEAKKNLEKISESIKENITLTAVEDSGESFSFAKSVNKGLEEINADIYLNMNDDVTLSGNSLEKAIKIASSMNTVVGAILNFPDGHIQHAGISVNLVSSTIDGSFIGYFLKEVKIHRAPFDAFRKMNYMRSMGLNKFLYINHYRKINPSNKGIVTGAFHMFSSGILKSTGGYDENYRVGFEDIDFCLRALQSGINIRLSTEIKGIHNESISTGRVVHSADIIKYFQEKWANEQTVKLIEDNGPLYLK